MGGLYELLGRHAQLLSALGPSALHWSPEWPSGRL